MMKLGFDAEIEMKKLRSPFLEEEGIAKLIASFRFAGSDLAICVDHDRV